MADDYKTLVLGTQGRLVIPAAFRQAMGVAAGDQLVAALEGGVLRLEPRAAVIQRVQDTFSRAVADDPDPVASLIAERRVEAALEAADEAAETPRDIQRRGGRK